MRTTGTRKPAPRQTGREGHLVLGVDVSPVLQQQCSRGDGRDGCSHVQGRVPVAVRQVGVCMVLQQDAHTALMLALHCLPWWTRGEEKTFTT